MFGGYAEKINGKRSDKGPRSLCRTRGCVFKFPKKGTYWIFSKNKNKTSFVFVNSERSVSPEEKNNALGLEMGRVNRTGDIGYYNDTYA